MSSGGDSPGVKLGSSSTKPSNNDEDVIIEERQESGEYEQDLKVVLGTTIGVIVVVGLLVVAVLLYRVYRSRQRALSYVHQHDNGLQRNVSIDMRGKYQPMVLLLYANDCQMHQRVVEALANFLMEVMGVTVSLDLLEETEITDRGVDEWLVDRLQEADFIMVVCSLGARLRCSKRYMQFKPSPLQRFPDYFCIAVDYVAEKMRVEKHKGLSMDKFIVVYLEYSTQSDIPPQLETASQFCLMKDVQKLHTHLKTSEPESVKSDNGSSQEDSYTCHHETETGAFLLATIEQTKTYFKENPSWMDQNLELLAAGRGGKAVKCRKRNRNSPAEPLLLVNGSVPVGSHELETIKSGRRSSHISGGGQDSVARLDGKTCYFRQSMDPENSAEILRGRHNSLPSSFAMDKFSLSISQGNFSNSVNNVSVHSNNPDGVPCLYCGLFHLYEVLECRRMDASSLSPQDDSVQNLHNTSLKTFSNSETVLQAEVHKEWGTPVKSNMKDNNGKSNTFGGNIKNLESDPSLVPHYNSLPPHPPLYNDSLDWEWDGGMKLRKWDSFAREPPTISKGHGKERMKHFHISETLSQSSVSTSEMESSSETDSLQRDLNSIQHISSFQEFVNSSLFLSPRSNERAYKLDLLS